MKRSLSSRRDSSSTEQRGRKRQKLEKSYSTREIPWKEQRALGGAFSFVGKGAWPVLRITAERKSGKRTQYLIQWRPHPRTHEEFKPEWIFSDNVDDDSIAEWEKVKEQREEHSARQEELLVAPRARRHPALPDSSADDISGTGPERDASRSPPSLLSGSSASGLDVLETQYPEEHLRVNLPSLPQDKAEYETVQSTQVESSSPYTQVPLSSNQSQLLSSTNHSQQSLHPTNSLATAVADSQSLASQPIVIESSSKTFSPRQSPRSSLGQFVASIFESVQSSYPVNLITQLPHSQHTSSHQGSQTATSPVVPRGRFTRLASPFQDTPISQPTAPSKSRPTSSKSHNDQTMSTNELGASRPETTDHYIKSPLANSINHDDLIADEPLFHDGNQDVLVVAPGEISIPLMIHESIEEEPQSSTDTSNLLDSKANSSQESLNNEREIETVDGVMIPALPIFGPCEHAVALPAEGRVKSIYDEIIKLKKRAILRFIRRKGSPGTSEISSKKTLERNEMQEMLSRLNDTTTHMDLGLPNTQDPLTQNPEQNAAHAEYAGSKFTFLGYLIDQLKTQNCSIAIFAQGGTLQDLLEEYLIMKGVLYRRWDGAVQRQSVTDLDCFSVDLLSTEGDESAVLPRRPALILAFDISFMITDPQVQALYQQFDRELPIIHLLVTNSSEHVERCVPVSFTSNIRLKVVVRTTYLAAPNLGGDITYVPDPSDQPTGRPMDMSDLQRAVRKSPARRLNLIADIVANHAISGELNHKWSLGGMPELKLVPLDSPPRVSRAASRTPQPLNTRTQTPASRATTPVTRKRLLEVEGDERGKRQRLTPVHDSMPGSDVTPNSVEELREARKQIAQLISDLSNAGNALTIAEKARTTAETKAQEWRDELAEVLRRYEIGRNKRKEIYKENKELQITLTNMKARDEVTRTEKALLRQQLTDSKAELVQARNDLKTAGVDVAELEEARALARDAAAKTLSLEKSLKTTKSDFDFTRSQYQDASKRAVDLASEIKELQEQVEHYKLAADDTKRSLKAMNYKASINKAMETAELAGLEVKSRDTVIKRLQEENAMLKSRRGVQTRGSSIQPAGSPAPRSRQASPAPGHLTVPTGSRTSLLRNER
ncbi:hypothetical protein LTR05_002855 [Lithohypha guttulata]|uniref:Chromo domain-containing protein n=1 Tax=Lithohypha guttulata TaxID=1690604 RepID=A0AAN7YCN8_9EURO|nr:hypothetical protein LTR05_002855 [Lithohypha guttulata]